MTRRAPRWARVAVAVALAGVGLAAWLLLGRSSPGGHDLYVDCRHGNDAATGTRAAPFRTLSRAARLVLGPDQTLFLAAGCTWNTAADLTAAGRPGHPARVDAYGTGAAPTLTGIGLAASPALLTLSGSQLVVRSLHLTQAAGVAVDVQAADTTLTGLSIDHAGTGVDVVADHVSVDQVAVRDLHMIRNTPGGNDDYGAVGFTVEAPNAQIADSSCVNCRAPSYDYGYDGGFVEIWNEGDNLSVHDNYSNNTDGYLEIGGDRKDGSAKNVRVFRNIMNDVHGGVWIHHGDVFSMPVEDVLLENNTIVDSSPESKAILGGDLSHLTLVDNSVYTVNQITWNQQPEIHSGNRYYVNGQAGVGYPPGPTETVSPLSAWPGVGTAGVGTAAEGGQQQ